jgi:hypothetical protein
MATFIDGLRPDFVVHFLFSLAFYVSPWSCAWFNRIRNVRRQTKSENWDCVRAFHPISLLDQNFLARILFSNSTSSCLIHQHFLPRALFPSSPSNCWYTSIPPTAGCKTVVFMTGTDVALFCSFQTPGLNRTGCTQKVSLNQQNTDVACCVKTCIKKILEGILPLHHSPPPPPQKKITRMTVT